MRQSVFDAAVAAHGSRVWTLAVYLLGDATEAEDVDPSSVGDRILGAVDELTASGWHQILKVEEDDQLVVFFALESGGKIQGLTGMVSEGGEEVVLINLVGDVDPVLLGRCLSKVHRFDGFDELMEMAEK